MSQQTRHAKILATREAKAIAALLQARTIREASTLCNVSESTLHKFLLDPDFRGQLREASQRSLDGAMALLRASCREATATLRQALHCEHPPTAVAAAKAILDTAGRWAADDLAQRVEALERQLQREDDNGRTDAEG